MSSRTCNNWKEAILGNDSYDRLNRHAQDVIKISHFEASPSASYMLEKLRNDPTITMIGQSQVTQELFLMHHLEEISGGIGSSFRSLACLQGWGVKATPLQISAGLLNEGLDLKCPSKESLWNAGSSEELMNLEPLRGKEKRVFKCRSLASLPPFVTKTIVESGSSDPKDTCFLTLSACKAFYESIKETPSASETKDSLCDLLSYF